MEKPQNEDSAKVKVKVRVNQNGIFTVNSAILSETVEQVEPEPEPKASEQLMDVDEEKKQTEGEKSPEGEEQPQVNGESEVTLKQFHF